MRDPRKSIRYARMNGIIDILGLQGPMTIEELCLNQGLTYQQFRAARYSLPGQMAMEDREVVVPRPVTSEGYVYKLALTYQSGNVADDAEPNLQKETSDLLTRVATIYLQVEQLIEFVPGRSYVRKLLRKLQKSLDGTLDRAEDVAEEAAAVVSPRARHVLDRIS